MSDKVNQILIEGIPQALAEKIEADEAAEKDDVFTLSELELLIGNEGEEDPNELIEKRFFCKGHIDIITAQTGCGKSSFVMQMIFCFAMGIPCFGLKPKKALKTLLIQGENDRRDLYEEITGIQRGLSYHDVGITYTAMQRAMENITIRTCTKHSGDKFVQHLDEILSENPNAYDMLVIDPLFSYAGCDISKEQGKVSGFLRNGINTVIRKHNIGCIFVHHMNKPSKNPVPQDRNYNILYDYSGSGEIANLARAVLVLERLKDDDGNTYFRLTAHKRGERIEPDFCKTLAWAKDGGIFWEEFTPKINPVTVDSREQEKEKRRQEEATELAQQAAALLKPGEVISKKDFRERVIGMLKITNRTKQDLVLTICIQQGFVIEREPTPDEKKGRTIRKVVQLPPEEAERNMQDEVCTLFGQT